MCKGLGRDYITQGRDAQEFCDIFRLLAQTMRRCVKAGTVRPGLSMCSTRHIHHEPFLAAQLRSLPLVLSPLVRRPPMAQRRLRPCMPAKLLQ